MIIYFIQLLSFLAFLYLWLLLPLRFLKDPIAFISSKNPELKKSYWLFYSIDMLYLVFVGILMLVAGFYAELKFLWLILAICVFAISLLSLSTIIMRINTHEQLDHEKEVEKAIAQRIEQIPQKRKIAMTKIAISIIWIYSWQGLFI